jgi:hypothetical protein
MPRRTEIARVSQLVLLAPEPVLLDTVFLHLHVIFYFDDARQGRMLRDRARLQLLRSCCPGEVKVVAASSKLLVHPTPKYHPQRILTSTSIGGYWSPHVD